MKKTHSETYRSGHNENDSKSFCLHGHEGSNPSVSAIKNGRKRRKNVVFLFENRKNVLIIRWLLPQNTRKGNALCLLKAIYKIVKCKNGGHFTIFIEKIFF